MDIKKNFKKIKRKIIKFFQYILTGIEYIKLKKIFLNSDNLIVLIGTPEYGNLGDHLIAIAEKNFLNKFFPSNETIEITMESYKRNREKIWSLFEKANIEKLVITGGGFLGDIWRDMQLQINEIMEKCPSKQTIIMPQTVFYINSQKSESSMCLDKFYYALRDKFIFFVRDKSSYDLIKENNFVKKDYYLVPDVALYFTIFPLNVGCQKKRNQILFCLRNDLERTIASSEVGDLTNYIKKQKNIKIIYRDTVDTLVIMPSKREIQIKKFLSKVCASKLVITDRLHCMIMCYIFSVPCIAIDNISKKISGTFNWISNCNYIKCVSNMDECQQELWNMLECIPITPDVSNLEKQFERIAYIIQERN